MKEIVSIIVTHENRLRCILRNIIETSYHYKNCCIIKLSLTKKMNKIHYDISLIYDGDSHKNMIYYTTEIKPTIDNNKEILFPNLSNSITKLLNIKSSDLKNNILYTFFMIRHAQSEHNLYNIIEKLGSPLKLDTSLTDTGVKQSEKAGIFLNKYLKNNKLSINYLFASDLKRTRQTLSIILSKINIIIPSIITIIPCSHEVLYTKKDNCDKNMILSLGSIAGENRMSCNTNCNINKDEQCCEIKYKNKKYNIDWTFYNKFYKGSRKFTYMKDNKQSCSNNDYIEMMVDYINSLK